jgi:ATP-dependent protease Clp ATPase subunit
MKTNQDKHKKREDKMNESNAYKYEEIKEHFEDFIKDQDKDWIKENFDDLHHHAFNNDYYIIGRYQAKKWLGDEVFEIINIIKDYENDNFGEVNTDFSDAEKVVNMYTYIIGEDVVNNWKSFNYKEVA